MAHIVAMTLANLRLGSVLAPVLAEAFAPDVLGLSCPDLTVFRPLLMVAAGAGMLDAGPLPANFSVSSPEVAVACRCVVCQRSWLFAVRRHRLTMDMKELRALVLQLSRLNRHAAASAVPLADQLPSLAEELPTGPI